MYTDSRLYEASVLVNGRPVTEVFHNGLTYIEGRKNSVFTLRFNNWSWRRVLLIPSVDGINTIDRKICGKQSQGYVIEARGSITIPGWTLDQNGVGKFIFKSQGAAEGKDQTFAEAVGDPENQGVIGFMVFEEAQPQLIIKHTFEPGWNSGDFYGGGYGGGNRWTFNSNTTIGSVESSSVVCDSLSLDDAPKSSVVQKRRTFGSTGSGPGNKLKSRSVPTSDVRKGEVHDGAAAAAASEQLYSANVVGAAEPAEASLGTGIGKEVEFKTREVHFERASSEPAAVFMFRYDNLTNLKRMGVPTHQFKPAVKREKAVNPFPASPEVAGPVDRIPTWYKRRR